VAAHDREGILTVNASPSQPRGSEGPWLSSVAAAGESTLLSVCIPVFKFDVVPLVDKLLQQAALCGQGVEVLIVDDGSDDRSLIHGIRTRMDGSTVPVRLLILPANEGRARVRNHLIAASKGDYLLFLDCDMYPDSDDFLLRYLDFARTARSDIVVGGCSYAHLGRIPVWQALYYYHSKRTQCVAAEARRRNPLRYVFTNNMLIRRSLLDRLTFDSGYEGWGYEDTDLAIRAARAGAVISHVENTATHLGLIDDAAVIGKYRNSVPNFVRLIRKFPREAWSFPIYRAATRLARLPLPFERLSARLESLVRRRWLPVTLRYASLQCMKLLMYSGALKAGGESLK
jgi:glycosyltransferase involved in cell wall biosynthesis